jgi:hypothetical protein
MLLKPILVVQILLFAAVLFGQEKFTLSGTITDAENGETLIGASVFVPATGTGTTTNEYGFYSLQLPGDDSIKVVFSYVGFQNQTKTILLKADLAINIELGTGVQLEEVIIKANSFEEQLRSTEMSVEALSTKEVKMLPAILGETDILRTIQLKPGIPSGGEGTTGLFVRGGGSDQNLIVLDEALVYNPNHLFGFFSTFNTDAVKDLKLYKGGFPAQYGGRLSSVIDVKLKEGNNKKFSGSGGLGLISSRLTLEGPIQKGKSSFIVSGRRTYFDLITDQINRSNADNPDANLIPGYYFYDLNTKVNFKLSDKDHLFLSGYFGRDKFSFESDFFDFGFDWGNATGTVRWNHTFSPTLFNNTTITFSDYRYQILNDVTGFSFDLNSNIKDLNFKTDFYQNVNEQHTLRYGGNVTYHQFTVGRLKAGSDDGTISFSAGQEYDGVEFGAYISDDYNISPRITLNGGLRFSGFSNDGTTYFGVEPRLASNFKVSSNLSVKASYARMFQYMHLVSNSGISLPTDIWYPSTALVKPQISDQVAAGYSWLFELGGTKLFLTNEYFYKWLDRQVDFIDGAQLFANDDLEQEFVFGNGFAYGGEISIEKKEGDLTGWIGYTLSRIRRGEFEGPQGTVMDGRYFSPRYDRRHDISVVLMYKISERWSAGTSWVYGSGDLTWLPRGRYTFQDIPGVDPQVAVPVYGDRNDVRLAAFHRLDLNLVYKFFPKWGESDLTLSVINAYDRRNAFFVYLEPQFKEGEEDPNGTFRIPEGFAAKQVSLFPILPALTWNFKF